MKAVNDGHEKVEALVLVQSENDRRSGYGHITVSPVYIGKGYTDDDHVRLFRDETGLRNLQAYCQFETKEDQFREAYNPYAFKVQYRDVFYAELEDARRMAKTLGLVERRIEKLRQEWGYAQDFGTYGLRFAKAIGAKRFLTSKNKGASGYFNTRPVAELPTYVAAELARMKEHHNGN